MKRVWIFVGTGILLLALLAWWYSQREWLTDRLLAQIKMGMKKDQVEALLGKPENGYKLADWGDFDFLGSIFDSSPITVTAPNNPWLPTLKPNGPFIRKEGLATLSVLRSGPRSNTDSILGTPWVWVGRERALILKVDNYGVYEIRAFPVIKSGGGFFSWLSRKYDDWMQGK